jgi:putative spermidine/putrescine transport system permease protein
MSAPASETQSGIGRGAVARPVLRIENLGWKLLIVPAMLWLGVFYIYPVVAVLMRSITDFNPPQVGGLDNFIWFFTTRVNTVVLFRTFWISIYVTVICLVLGYPLAYLLTLTRGWVRLLLVAAIIIPLTTSPLVRSFAWIGLLQPNGPIVGFINMLGLGRPEFIGNLSGVTIGMVHIQLPLMVLPLFATLERIDRRLLTAAGSLGATPLSAFVRVYLPLSMPGVIAGSVLVFVHSLGFYLTPALLGSPQQALLSPLIVMQTQLVLAWGRAGAMALVLFVSTMTLLALAAVLSRAPAYARRGGKP